jgi:hypothetical protein
VEDCRSVYECSDVIVRICSLAYCSELIIKKPKVSSMVAPVVAWYLLDASIEFPVSWDDGDI